jgi:hypothetical protein
MTRRRISISSVCAGVGLLLGLSSQLSLGLGGQFGFEFAIDAPWRLEPVKGPDGNLTYGPIPITIIFDDAVFELARPGVSALTPLNPIDVGRLREVRVVEWVADQPHPRQPVTTITAREFREIQRKGPVSTLAVEPDHDICHPSAAQSCDEVLNISRSHEWHGAFWYTPKAPVTPGRNIHLEVTVITELPGGLYTREWKNYLVVHAGEAPLPRFADDWLYGDFHYHSQMTDNEGESGYSYRNVARALGASGIDFVFATDHASNGVQQDGKIAREYCADKSQEKCSEARDFNPNRFRVAKNLLYGSTGINAEIALEADTRGLARLRSANVLPQVYLGEEVDAQPEMSQAEFDEGILHFGDGRRYEWPNPGHCEQQSGADVCRKRYSQAVDGGYLILDEQGIPIEEKIEEYLGDGTLNDVVKWFAPDGTKVLPSRQHLVYFPSSVSQNTDGWIASDTGPFGGASKRLGTVVGEVERGGVAFLAHPQDNSRPGGPAGPDIVPYSAQELDIAWRSPAILGLQFWNENDRYRSEPDVRSPSVMFTGANSDNPRAYHFWFNWPFQGNRFGSFPWKWDKNVLTDKFNEMLYHGAYTWDRYLRKGVDPAQLGSLSWLPAGQPRRWFMAGGSDSHGDFNYRRYGQPGDASRWTDVPVGDTAIGQPRNLVSMSTSNGLPEFVSTEPAPGPIRYTNQQVIESLRAGRFSVTDGPAIRIALDRNLNGKIDDGDTQMGGVLDFFPGDRIPLLVEWRSTPEFGPIAKVDVYVGNDRVTFAPRDHGAGIPGGVGQAGFGSYTQAPSSVLTVQLADVYGVFNRAPLSPDIAYHGTAAIYLGPGHFGLARAEGALSYVRAFASTILTYRAADLGICPQGGTAGSHCGSRYAFANPVWTRYVSTCPSPASSPSAPSRTSRFNSALRAASSLQKVTTFIDKNGNRMPDACENTLANACPPETNPTGAAGEITDQLRNAIDRAGTNELVDPNAPPSPPQLVAAPPSRPIPGTSCQVLPAPTT